MAKRGRRQGARAAADASKKVIATHGYGNKKHACYGKHVRAGRGTKKIARVFCSAKLAAQKAGQKAA